MNTMKSRMIWAAAAVALALAGRVQALDPNAASAPGAMPASVSRDAQSVISAWPDNTKKAAQALIEKYGQPDGISDRMLVWNDKDQWNKVAVFRDAVRHDAPIPHQDFLENTISYRVPESKVADLVKFDQALVVDLSRGTLASHCDSEEANTLALNLANDIVTGKRSAASARSFMRDTLMKSTAGKSSPYMQKLQFQSSQPQNQPEAPNQPVTPPSNP